MQRIRIYLQMVFPFVDRSQCLDPRPIRSPIQIRLAIRVREDSRIDCIEVILLGERLDYDPLILPTIIWTLRINRLACS